MELLKQYNRPDEEEGEDKANRTQTLTKREILVRTCSTSIRLQEIDGPGLCGVLAYEEDGVLAVCLSGDVELSGDGDCRKGIGAAYDIARIDSSSPSPTNPHGWLGPLSPMARLLRRHVGERSRSLSGRRVMMITETSCTSKKYNGHKLVRSRILQHFQFVFTIITTSSRNSRWGWHGSWFTGNGAHPRLGTKNTTRMPDSGRRSSGSDGHGRNRASP